MQGKRQVAARACARLGGSFWLVLTACNPQATMQHDGGRDAPSIDVRLPDASTAGPIADGGAGPGPEPDAGPLGDAGASPIAPVPPPRATRTVLLVPGTMITGDYFETMAVRLEADGFDPVVYEAPDLLTGSLARGAERIGEAVDRLRAERGLDRVHIVAECNGGVATRYYLQVLGGHAAVDQVVTFVSAHHGTWLSPIGDWATGFQALEDITPGSALLATLDAAPFPPGLRMTSIYSCHDELMLPYETSVVEGATNVLFCDHFIMHLDGFWDPVVYERIADALEGRGDSAPARL
ncbi:MAG: hypothetical protein IT378_23340 [Sandaracinaceae bacterium]|nr:hypothetical protein [Sandaracinaceae bacterium]